MTPILTPPFFFAGLCVFAVNKYLHRPFLLRWKVCPSYVFELDLLSLPP